MPNEVPEEFHSEGGGGCILKRGGCGSFLRNMKGISCPQGFVRIVYMPRICCKMTKCHLLLSIV